VIAVILTALGLDPSLGGYVKQLALHLGLLLESSAEPAIPLATELKCELVTQMAAVIITVYRTGGNATDEHTVHPEIS
jgi:hypothetical protein